MQAKILYNTLSTIGEIASPQLNAFVVDNNYAKPITYAFRFNEAKLDLIDSIYLLLIDIIANYDGNTQWIMHKHGWHKNYIIEPLEFYYYRKALGIENISTYMGEMKFQTATDKFINDLPP